MPPDKFSPEERAELTKDFSFDVDLMHRRLDSGDDWQCVIQAHLFIDHILTHILNEELKRPDKMKIDRMTVASKADLAVAMGLIDDNLYTPFRRINRLRNQIAHDLAFKIGDDEAKQVRDLCDDGMRALIDDADVARSPRLMGRVLKVFIVMLDVVRQVVARRRVHEAMRRAKLEEAIVEARLIVQELDHARAIDR